MQTSLSFKSALLSLIIVLIFLVSWELYLRHKGVLLDYDDGAELWSNNRAMVYEPADKATVFIGSSRIKYDLDISSGTYLAFEKKNYPRNEYWDKLLTITGCKGVHFADHPVIDQLTCPEYSHLKPKDAVIYTQNLVGILKKEQVWKFK